MKAAIHGPLKSLLPPTHPSPSMRFSLAGVQAQRQKCLENPWQPQKLVLHQGFPSVPPSCPQSTATSWVLPHCRAKARPSSPVQLIMHFWRGCDGHQGLFVQVSSVFEYLHTSLQVCAHLGTHRAGTTSTTLLLICICPLSSLQTLNAFSKPRGSLFLKFSSSKKLFVKRLLI